MLYLLLTITLSFHFVKFSIFTSLFKVIFNYYLRKKILRMIGAEQLLAEHGYQMGNFIGHGMTSECFEVFTNHFKQNDSFVCKLFELFPPENKNIIIKHFKEEVEILTLLDHPSVIRCYDYFESDKFLVIIMECCSGGSLYQYMCRNPKMDYKTYFSFIFQILDAINYCHKRRIAHLDIKPQNIFISRYGKIKLSDFGCAKMFKPFEKMKQKRGSTFFIAPENGVIEYDPFKADIYSLGVMFLIMYDPSLVLRTKDADNVWMMFRDAASSYGELGKILYDCLDREPEKRPDVDELRQRLFDYASSTYHLPILQSSQSGTSVFPQFSKQNLPTLKVAPCNSLRSFTNPTAVMNMRRGSLCRTLFVPKH